MRNRIANKELIKSFFGDKRNYNKLHVMCIKVFRNHEDAEDALHEIYIKLISNALTIDFPDNPEEVFPYMQVVIHNYHRDMIHKWKHLPARAEESEMAAMKEEESDTDSVNLEEINLYMERNSHLFTVEQQKLWQCIYNIRDITEMEDMLGKDRQSIAKLRYKLLVKIRRHIGLED